MRGIVCGLAMGLYVILTADTRREFARTICLVFAIAAAGAPEKKRDGELAGTERTK